MRRIGSFALYGLAAAVWLAACGGGDDDSNPGSGAGTGGQSIAPSGSGGTPQSGGSGQSAGSGGKNSNGSGGSTTTSGSGGSTTTSGSGGSTMSGSGGSTMSGSGGTGSDAGAKNDAGMSGHDAGDAGGGGGPFKITSKAFADGSTIDMKYRCMGAPSPDLMWSGAPAGTKSFAIVFKDVSTSTGTAGTGHWAIYDIPASVTSLPEGVMAGYMPTAPAGAKQAQNYMSDNSYTGPCYPIQGVTGMYEVTIYALDSDTLSGLTMTSTVMDVETAAAAHPLGMAKLDIMSAG